MMGLDHFGKCPSWIAGGIFMRKSIFYDKAKRSNKAKPDVSAWVKGICTVHESKRFTAIFYWIALVACLAVICSAFAAAGNHSVGGYVS